MRCIEIVRNDGHTSWRETLNSNMRCIEIDNFLKEEENLKCWTVTWDVLK